MNEINVAVITLNSTADKSKNISEATKYIEAAAKSGSKWIALPEMMSFHGPYDQLSSIAEFEDGPLNAHLSSLAKKYQITLFSGSVCEKSKNESRVYNTQYIFNPKGEMIAKYRKVHPFNLKDATGAKLYCESDGFLSGDTFVKIEVDGFQVAIATCYDLRFPEMFLKLAPFDVLMIPSAFTQQTGMFHWELLLRARAVEYLAYVVAPNQTGTHSPGKTSFGHSMIIDPWGNKLCDTDVDVGLATATLSKEVIAKYRKQLPVYENKRIDLY